MTGITGDNYDIASTFTNLVHTVFRKDKKNFDIYPLDPKLWDKIQKKEGFQGSEEQLLRATSLAGGYGFSGSNSSFPRANESELIRPKITTSRFYGVAKLDTKSIAEAINDKGAFCSLMDRVKHDMERKVRNGMSLALFHTNIDDELVLGTIASGGVTSSGGGVYVLTLDTHKKELFHVKQILQIEDGNTDNFEVTSVGDSTLTVTRLTGTQVPVAGDELFLDGGDGNAFTGLKAVTAASGTLYNVSIGGQWKSTIHAKSGTPNIDEDMLFNLALDVENHCGVKPNLLITSKEQIQKMGEFLSARSKPERFEERGGMGHKDMVLHIPGLALDVMWDRHCDADRVYMLNTEHMEFYKSPMSGLVKHSGSILQPDYINGTDTYLMVYRLYGQIFIEPCYVGVITGLSTTVS